MSSSVLLTNLINRVQPILRYNLGDRVTFRPDACPCGSPFPAIRVDGRTDEIMRLQNAVGEWVPVLPLAIWAVIKQSHKVQRFQVIQTGRESLKIRLEPHEDTPAAEAWADVQAQVQPYLSGLGLPHVQLELAEEPPMRDARSGKFRHVWSEFKAVE
jgi:phenylacetate-CoA ligase